MKEKRIIGFSGRKRSGKTSICEFLKNNRGAEIITVASSLKELCADMYGISEDCLKYYKDTDEYLPLNYDYAVHVLSKSLPDTDYDTLYKLITDGIEKGAYVNVRSALQYIGTDIIRRFNSNWHVEKMTEKIMNSKSDLVVIDDVRFPNERKAIEDLGGDVYFIIRPDISVDVSNHESETSLVWQDFNDSHVILNMFSLDFMEKEFDELFNLEFTYGYMSPIFKLGYCDVSYNENFGYKKTCNGYEENIIRKYVLPSLADNGCFTIPCEGNQMIVNIEKILYKTFVHHNSQGNVFAVWNPFIIENLKMWIGSD